MKTTWFIGFCLIWIQVSAQDTVVELSQVQISASRLDLFTTGLKTISIDSLTLENRRFDNLDEIIARETPIYVRSYGQGSLATIAFRGTSSTHTGIYWNGLPLNPPNIRMFDLSLAPAAYFNSVQILSGGSGSLFGSGNIGGSIHLGNQPVFDDGISTSASLSAGSFSDYGASARVSLSTRKFYSSTSLLYKDSENDFPYQNLQDEEVKQQNAAYQHYGAMQDLYWKLHQKWLAGASIWLQSTSRQIPATMVTSASEAKQDDQSVKTILSLKRFDNKGSTSLKLAFFRDDLHYMDPNSPVASDRDSKVVTDKIIAEIQDNRRLFENTHINTGINYSYEAGKSNNYDGFVSQNQLGFFASVLQRIPSWQWQINLNLRQDVTEGYAVPFTPALGLEGKIWKPFHAKINISRNFRIPSMNELYWKPYGNPDLEPEESWNEEVSLVTKFGKQAGKHSSEFIATVYNSNVTNWIVWIPDGNDWNPENIRNVWSRGLEFSGNTSIKIKQVAVKVNEGYTYARSTNENKVYSYDNSYQKQLIYIPVHRMFMNIYLASYGFRLNYNFTITGQRFTTSDNQQSLPWFSLSNLTLGKDFKLKQNSLDVQFEINNLWNKNYQAIAYYPMPGRSFKVSINFKFNSL